MKIYDKEMYKTSESLQTIILVIAVFFIGFFIGYITSSKMPEKSLNNSENVITIK